MSNKKWLKITEDTFNFSKGEIFIAERRENDGWVISEPDNPFNIEWVEDGVYELLSENPFA